MESRLDTKLKFIFKIICLSFFILLSSCISKGRIEITLFDKSKTIKPFNVSVANVQVLNHQVIITGTNLDAVTAFKIQEGATTAELEIESQSNTSIVANTLSNVTFAAGKVFDFILSNANAASTFTVNFSLCDSTLGGKGFDCLIVPNDKDVLSFDAATNKWVPRNVNGLTYKGTFDASPGVDPGGSPLAGDYYLVSIAGTINTVSYLVGDWIVYNEDDLAWQKVSNSKDVLSVFGRTGKISAKEGDYSLTKMSDVDLTTVPPVLDQILKFNGTTWVPGTVSLAAVAGTVSAPGYSFNGNINTGFYSPAANQIGITNNGVESVRIDASGNVGIGTASPSARLHLTAPSSSSVTALPNILTVAAPANTGTGSGSGVSIVAGAANEGGVQAGSINLTSGQATGPMGTATGASIGIGGAFGGATGGGINIQSGNGRNTSGGGPISITAGNGPGAGAAISLTAGDSWWEGDGGNIVLNGGVKAGAGAAGNIILANLRGNVGIGTTTPRSKLEVNGSVQVGVDAAACTATNAGAMRFATPNIEFCNGTAWASMASALAYTPIDKAGDTITTGIFNFSGSAVLRTLDPVGPTDVATKQYVDGFGQWVKGTGGNVLDIYRASGNVGIGTATPVESLDVNGAVKVGETVSVCSVANKGSIRYNNTTSVLEFCNGTAWNLIQAAACTDPNPNVISFADEANATASTLYTAATTQVTGINCSVPVTISGQGGPQYQICSDAGCSTVIQGWTSSPSSITNNQYIQTRLTADSVGGSSFQATIIVGSGASVWTVTTEGGDCTLSPTPGTVCADGTLYAGLSPDGNVKMFTTRCDAGQTWSGAACTGSRSGLSWNNGTSNWTTAGVTGNTTGKANSNTLNGLVDIGAPYIAAQYCESLNQDGKTDWYLPALTELNVLYTNKLSIKNFEVSGSSYWSSTETANTITALYKRFSDGGQSDNVKNSGFLVRCVRR